MSEEPATPSRPIAIVRLRPGDEQPGAVIGQLLENEGIELVRVYASDQEFEADRRSVRARAIAADLRSGRRVSRSGRPSGRPRVVTLDLERQAMELRGYQLGENGWFKPRTLRTWREVAKILHLPAGTLSKLPGAIRRRNSGAEKGAATFRAGDAVSQHLPGGG